MKEDLIQSQQVTCLKYGTRTHATSISSIADDGQDEKEKREAYNRQK